MKIVIAMDSLKGSLTSMEARMAAAAGIRKTDKKAEVFVRPLADGEKEPHKPWSRGWAEVFRLLRLPARRKRR